MLRFIIEYIADPSDHHAQALSTVPLALDFNDALQLARNGLPEARRLLGAIGFCIHDRGGAVLAFELTADLEP